MSSTGQVTVLRIFDEIGGMFGVPAADIVAELDAAPGDVELRLSSPGGDVFDGLAIYAALRQRPGMVTVVVEGLAASIASVIAMAASPGRLAMAEGSMAMVHDAWGACRGDTTDMLQMADLLDKASDNIASIYARRTGLPAWSWRQAMRAETWYTAGEAVAAALADVAL